MCGFNTVIQTVPQVDFNMELDQPHALYAVQGLGLS